MQTSLAVLVTMICSASSLAQEQKNAKPISAVLVIVNERGNPKLKKISFSTLRKIYNCEIKNWKNVPGSDRTDPILAYASDEISEASLLFKRLVGNVQLANCVSLISGLQSDRIIASGLAALPPDSKAKEVLQGIGIISADLKEIPKGVRVLAVSDNNAKPAGPFVAPTEEAIRSHVYPLAEKGAEHSKQHSARSGRRPVGVMLDR